ncbi:MAG: recombinase family protein [Tepidisphaeraceae bacterium]
MQEKFFIYARKSTESEDRQIRSIGDQLAELREVARRDGLTIHDTLVEMQSAKIPGRPVFNEMIARIEAGEATGILAWHPDRLARNSVDGGRIVYLVDTGKIKELKFPTFWFEPTPQGKFMLSIMFGQSKYYVDSLSENIRRGQRQKLKNGIMPGATPTGYLNDRMTRTVVIDPVRAPLVRKAFELYATGDYTLDRITETVRNLGLTSRQNCPLSRAQCHRMFQNPMYYGVIEYCGELYDGKHPAIVTKDLFDRVQNASRRKSKPKTPTLKPYLYRGFLRCGECGCWITTERQKGNNYLRCTKRVKKDCSQRYLREDAFALQLDAYLRRLTLPAGWADWMRDELEKERDEDASAGTAATEAIRLLIKNDEERIERLMQGYLGNALSLEEYRKAKSRIINEKRQKEEDLAELDRHRSGWFEPAIRFAKDLKTAEIAALSHDPAEKLKFAKTTGSNFRLVNRELVSLPPTRCVATRCESRFFYPIKYRARNCGRDICW